MRKLTSADFWNRLVKSDYCWEYPKSWDRYGSLKYQGKTWAAHRLAWTLMNGEIPDDLWVLHKCDNPPCCRPDHLFLGTNLDNMKDMLQKGRKARGEAHWSKKYPEKVARGEQNGAVKHRERMPRGDRHGSKTHPEKWVKGKGYYRDRCPEFSVGTNNGRAIMNPDKVREIRIRFEQGETQTYLAEVFGIKQTTVSGICRRKLWPHVD